jgi:hypothetical protein
MIYSGGGGDFTSPQGNCPPSSPEVNSMNFFVEGEDIVLLGQYGTRQE